MIKNLFFYWLLPVLWMVFLFPTNETLTHDSTLRFIMPVLTWILHHADSKTIELIHTLIRKAGHFLGYSLLAFLLFRAFRSGRRFWKLKWIVFAGIISLAYAALDEYIQVFLPIRSGRFTDWMINATGVFCTLGLMSLKFRTSPHI